MIYPGNAGARIGCYIVSDSSMCSIHMKQLIHYLEMQNYCVGYPVFHVHPFQSENLSYINCANLIRLTEESFQEFMSQCDIVIVIGCSLGGLIATYLAGKYNVDALVTMNTPVNYDDLRNHFRKNMDLWRSNQKNNLERYFRNLLGFSFHFKKLVAMMKKGLSQLKCPLLVIQGKKDDRISWKSAYFIYDNVATTEKEIQFFPKSGHHICMDCENNLVFIRIYQFIGKIVGNKLLVNGHL